MKKAALHNLGCKVNAYETEAMRQMLEEAGYEIVSFSDKADVYVINTCTVTNIADRKSRQMIHRARRKNPEAVIVAAGCYVQASPQEAAADHAVDILIGNNHKSSLIEKLAEFEKNKIKQCEITEISAEHSYEPLHIAASREHTRAFLKIQDGCDRYCSYCLIPYARGPVRSRFTEDIVTEVKRLLSEGILEIVLTGIHVSSFGKDTKESLIGLIETLNGLSGLGRIRLSSLEPGIITEEFVRRMASCEKVCPHFHLSLQSGCDTTLERMNRHYTTDEYREKCALLRRYYDHPAITTDIIAGFPGETPEEFAQTKQFLEEIHFYEMHVFKYSRREGTKAAAMPAQVPDALKTERSEQLIALGRQMSKQFREYYVQKEVEALLEEQVEIAGRIYYQGYTKEYVKVLKDAPGARQNQIIKMVPKCLYEEYLK